MSRAYNKLPGLVREDRTFTVPTIVAFDEQEMVLHNDNFRKAVERDEYLLFFQHDTVLYYPYAMEFRYIENNVLFLIVEYKINSFEKLARVLNSSYEKEEGFTVNIKALVHHTTNKPRFCHPIPLFVIEPEHKVETYEWTQNSTKTF